MRHVGFPPISSFVSMWILFIVLYTPTMAGVCKLNLAVFMNGREGYCSNIADEGVLDLAKIAILDCLLLLVKVNLKTN